jgi:hypothetical protein
MRDLAIRHGASVESFLDTLGMSVAPSAPVFLGGAQWQLKIGPTFCRARYPALYRVKEHGWIESEWGTSENNRRARFYRLTRAGRKQLQVEEVNWERFVLAIGKVMQTV